MQIKLSTWESDSLVQSWMEHQIGLPKGAKIVSYESDINDDECDHKLARCGCILLAICTLDEVAYDHDIQEEKRTKRRGKTLGEKPTRYVSIGYQFRIRQDDSSDFSDDSFSTTSEEEDLYSDEEDMN